MKTIQNILKLAVVMGVLGFSGFARGQEVRKGRFLERAAGKVEGVDETRLMLDVTQAPVGKVAEMLQIMSGTRMEVIDGSDRKITYKLEKGPVLKALTEALKQGGMTIDRPERSNMPINTPGLGVSWKEGSTQGYRLKAGDDLWKLPVSDAGWGMVFVSGVNRFSYSGYTASKQPIKEMTISMLLLTERNQQILRHSGFAQIEEAISEKGESLLLDKPINPELNLYARGLMPFSARIKSVERGTKIKSLKGKVFVAIELKAVEWEIGMGGQKMSKQVMEMETFSVEPSGGGGNFQISMKNEQKGGNRPSLVSQHLLEDRVLTNQAGEWSKAQVNESGAGWSTINGIYTYSQYSKWVQATGSIKVLLPADVKAIVIPFEFKDLELP